MYVWVGLTKDTEEDDDDDDDDDNWLLFLSAKFEAARIRSTASFDCEPSFSFSSQPQAIAIDADALLLSSCSMVASKAWSCEENNSKLNSSQLFIETVHDNDIAVAGLRGPRK